ncbi:MAG: SLC13 family permease [Spirochaetales bacterium]
MEAWIVGMIFILVFSLVLYRKIPIQYVSLTGAVLLIVTGIMPLRETLRNSVEWEVLFIYFGYGMLSVLLQESLLPRAIADAILPRLRSEKELIFYLSAVAALLSSFMPNPVVVLMVAPLALDVADRLKRNPFPYLVSIAIASNVVTTVTMVADPPAIILAMTTRMTFLDFYWLQGRPGLGTLSIVGVLVALFSLLLLHRKLNLPLHVEVEQYKPRPTTLVVFFTGIAGGVSCFFLKKYLTTLSLLTLLGGITFLILLIDRKLEEKGKVKEGVFHLGPATAFILSVFALILSPSDPPTGKGGWISWQGWVGLGLGLLCVITLGKKALKEVREYDWETTLFLIGIFIVVDSVDRVGLLSGFVTFLMGVGFKHPFWVFMLITWLSVILSAFIDNVPYTVLMIPVCGYFAKTLGINPHYLYYGMLIGTGIGGNITPVGATANVLACGMLEKRGIKINTLQFTRLSVPFSISAVITAQILIHIFWAR